MYPFKLSSAAIVKLPLIKFTHFAPPPEAIPAPRFLSKLLSVGHQHSLSAHPTYPQQPFPTLSPYQSHTSCGSSLFHQRPHWHSESLGLKTTNIPPAHAQATLNSSPSPIACLLFIALSHSTLLAEIPCLRLQ